MCIGIKELLIFRPILKIAFVLENFNPIGSSNATIDTTNAHNLAVLFK